MICVLWSCFWCVVLWCCVVDYSMSFFFFQAEDGIRDAQESRGLGDVYKRQVFGAFLCGEKVPEEGKLAAHRMSRGIDRARVVIDLSLIHI